MYCKALFPHAFPFLGNWIIGCNNVVGMVPTSAWFIINVSIIDSRAELSARYE